MARCWDDDNVNDLATILPNDDDDDDNNDNDGMMLGWDNVHDEATILPLTTMCIIECMSRNTVVLPFWSISHNIKVEIKY